jgi:hypothetical protein
MLILEEASFRSLIEQVSIESFKNVLSLGVCNFRGASHLQEDYFHH